VLKIKLPVEITGLELNEIIFASSAAASVAPSDVVARHIAVFSPAIMYRLYHVKNYKTKLKVF